MALLKRAFGRVNTMLCTVCLVGITVGIGGSILLYRILRRWLQRPRNNFPEIMGANVVTVDPNPDIESSECDQQETDSVECSSSGMKLRNDGITLRQRHCKVSHEDSGSQVSVDTGTNNNDVTQMLLVDVDVNEVRPSCNAVSEHHMASDNSRSQRNGLSLTDDSQLEAEIPGSIGSGLLGDSHLEAEIPGSIGSYLLGDSLMNVTDDNGLAVSEQLMSEKRNVYQSGIGFQHSTPDERDVPVAVDATESIYVCDYNYDEDAGTSVRNALSWHDYPSFETNFSRSCVSLDDSIFLRDIAFEGTDLIGCTAVTSLEQLEQQVAGVLSDCGDMERCFGNLRRRDSLRSVAKRYSLGVADSVMAAERRTPLTHRHEPTESPILDTENLSGSALIGRDSGYIWDDDGIAAQQLTGSFPQSEFRITRSLSPPPAKRVRRNNVRRSIGICGDRRVSGIWAGNGNVQSKEFGIGNVGQ